MMTRKTMGWLMIAAVCGAWSVRADDRTWNGVGANNFWDTPANWGGTAPTAGDALFFGGTARLNNTNTLAADSLFTGLTFNSGAGAFFLNGNRITLGGDVVNNDNSLQTINLPMILSATRTFNTAGTGSLTVNGLLSGDGGLIKTGPQTLTLSGANTYTGVLTIAEGRISVKTLNNANTAGVLGSNDTVIVLGSDGKSGSLFLNASGNTQNTDRRFTLAAGGTGGFRATGNSTAINVNGRVDGSGDLEVTGSSRPVTLAVQNTFTGDMRATDGGLLVLGGTGGTALNYEQYGGTIIIDAGARVSFGMTGNNIWNSVVINNGTFTLSNSSSGTATRFLGLISGTGSVQLSGSNGSYSIGLGDQNTYSGKTTFGNPGPVSVGSLKNADGTPSSLGAPTTEAAGTIDFSGGTLRYVGTGDTTDRVINLASPTVGATLDQSGTGLLKFTSDFTATGAGSKTLTLQGSGAGEIAGAVVNNSAVNKTALTKTGAGLWTLSGTNTYSGITTVKNGTLRCAGTNALGVGSLRLDPDNNLTAVLEADADLVRPGGTSDGEMRINGGGTGAIPGFSARGGDIDVAFGTLLAPEALTWNVAPFYPNSSTLILNADTADSTLTFHNPIDLNNTAAAVTRTFRVDAATAEVAGALAKSGAGAANVTKGGIGTLILSADNAFDNLTVSAGGLEMTGDNTFGNATVSGGSLSLTGENAFGNLTVSGGSANVDGINAMGNVSVSGTGVLTLGGDATYTNLTVSGGELTVAGSSYPAGTVTLSGGTLTLDYTEENNDKLDPAKSLTFAPGNFGSVALRVIGHAASPFTQAVNGLTLTRGAYGSIDIVSGQTSLDLGAVSRSAVVNMASSPGTVNATPVLVLGNAGSGTAIATPTGTASSLLLAASGAAFATVNGDWAAKDAANTTLVAGGTLPGFYAADTWGAGNNTDVTTGGSPASGSTTASLRFDTASANTVTLSGANTVTSGGILVTPTVGANLSRITGGSLAAGSGGKELVVIQNNTNGALQIDSGIAGVGYALTKAGFGTLALTAQNTFSGGYFLNQGTLQFGDGTTSGTLDQTAAASRCGDIVATGNTTIRVAAGDEVLTTILYRLTLGGANGTVMTIDTDANAVLQFKFGLSNINTGGTYPYWIKTGLGTLQNSGSVYGAPGWVREGLFIAGGNSFNGQVPNSGNIGSTIGDTAPDAHWARVELIGNITNFDPTNNGNDILTIRRTGLFDLMDKTVTSSWNMDNLRFEGGGRFGSGHPSPGALLRFWSDVRYTGASALDETAVIEDVAITLQNNVAFTINDSASLDTELEVRSDIGESGSRTLTKSGAGTMRLSGTNTYSGVTTASAGILTVAKAASLPNYNVNSKVAVSSSATLAVNAGGAGEWSAAEIDTLRGTTPSPFAAGAFFGIDTAGGDFTYGSTIGAGALGFRKLGPNALTLTGDNGWTGSKVVHAGTLVAGHANALGTSGAITVNSNAFLAVDTGVTFTRPVSFAAGSGLSGRGTFHAGGSWTPPSGFILRPGLPSGTLTIELGGTARTLTVPQNGELRIAFQGGAHGMLSVSGTLAIGEPTAKLVLTGTPSYGRHVLAEAVTLSETFAEIDMSDLKPQGTILYENNQIILNAQAAGTVLLLR